MNILNIDITINLPDDEIYLKNIHNDSVDEIIAAIKICYPTWTSLVITAARKV